MTWNLQRGQAVVGPLALADMAPFAALVATNRADVLGLQEATRDEARAVALALGWPAPEYVQTKVPCPEGRPPVPGACVPFGDAILSRFPLVDSDHWLLPPARLESGLEDRVVLRAVAEVDGFRLSVYVTHLASAAIDGEREAQAEALLSRIDDDRRAAGEGFAPVVLGDLNADPTDGAVTRLTGAGELADAWSEGTGAGLTSNATLGLERRIDYVLVGRDSGLRVLGATVDPEAISDHLAVVAELALPPHPPGQAGQPR